MTAARVSQQVVETLGISSPNVRVSQQVVETLGFTSSNLRASQIVSETLGFTSPHIRASQIVAETLGLTHANVRASQIVIEVLVVNWENPVLPIYPTLPGLTYDTTWSPTFYNMDTDKTVSGADIDLGIAQYPTHDFELTYAVLRNDFFGDLNTYGGPEFKAMMGFFLMIGGTLGRFLFTNPDDNSVTAQPEFTTDGTTSVYGPVIRTFGTPVYNGSEPVGVIDTGSTFNVYFDGVLQNPSTYTVLTGDPCNQQIQFHSTPTAGKAVTVDMTYFYYVKFPENTNTFRKFMNQLWSLEKVTLHSCRPGA